MSAARFARYVIAVAVALLLVAALPALAWAQGAAGATHPRLGTSGTSQNWAGYDVTGGGMHSATATWTEPFIVSSGSINSYAAFWVGLDGDGSSTVEQIGTEGYSQSGSVGYAAWFEMYPRSSVGVAMAIHPGDTLTATVTNTTRGTYVLSLVNHTTGASFTTAQSMMRAKDYSAEVITEAPWSGGVLPLANFGTASFTSAAFNGRPIGAFGNWQKIDMVTSGGTTKAATGALDASGAGFLVQWMHY